MIRTFWVAMLEAALGHPGASRRAALEFERDARAILPDRDGWQPGWVANAKALQADTGAVVRLTERALELAARSGDAMRAPTVRWACALALARVGAFDRAAGNLLALADLPSDAPSVAELELAPYFAEFRQSPRFPAVLAAFEAAEAEAAKQDAEEGY
jgi:hypothetical protein